MKNGTYSTHLKGKTINFLLFSGIRRDYRKLKGIKGNYKGLKNNSKAIFFSQTHWFKEYFYGFKYIFLCYH